MKLRISQRGASLIETLVAIGILGMIAYFVVGVLKTGTIGQKTLQNQDDARSITENMAAILSDRISCQNTFVTPASPINPTVTTEFTVIKNSLGVPSYEKDKPYGNKGLKLTGMRIGGSGTDAKSGIPKWSPMGVPPTSGAAFVEVEWTQTGFVKGNSTGPEKLFRYFIVNATSLGGAGQIADCVAQAAATSTSFWTLNADGHIYNNNIGGAGPGEGWVGVGTALPKGVFDVFSNSIHSITVHNSGNVGIGTIAPYVPPAGYTALTVGHTSAPGGGMLAFQDSGTDKAFIYNSLGAASQMVFQADSYVFDKLDISAVPVPAMVIRATSGNVGIGLLNPGFALQVAGDVQADSFISTSDARMKTDIRTVEDGLAKILRLRGTEFKWLRDGSQGIGLIAQEVEKVFPALVVADKVNGFKAVNYSSLIAPVIEAIKELYQMAVAISESVAKVTARVGALEARVAARDEAIRVLESRVEQQARELAEIKAKLEGAR